MIRTPLLLTKLPHVMRLFGGCELQGNEGYEKDSKSGYSDPGRRAKREEQSAEAENQQRACNRFEAEGSVGHDTGADVDAERYDRNTDD